MRLHLLVTSKMKPIPKEVVVLRDFGDVHLHVEGRGDGIGASGQHVVVEASKESIVTWLKPFEEVWVGKGHPALQEFEVCHIR